MKPSIKHFFHAPTWTFSYIVSDPESKCCAVIDPVLDFDYKASRTSTTAADTIIEYVQANALSVEWLLETHAHADHISAGHYLKSRVGGKLAIGEHIADVQKVFKTLFNLGEDFAVDGSQFDVLLKDGEEFKIGALPVKVLHTPGHTPACVTYVAGDAAFVGDTLFMPDAGTARADFPGGDAASLYRSIRKILALPLDTELHMCHDYKPEAPPPRWVTSVREQRERNLYMHDGVSEDLFVRIRRGIDRTLEAPVLILPSIQINIRAGELPAPEENGIRYLKIPLNKLGGGGTRSG